MNGMPSVSSMQCTSLPGRLEGSWGIAPQGGHERHPGREGPRRADCLRGHVPDNGTSFPGRTP